MPDFNKSALIPRDKARKQCTFFHLHSWSKTESGTFYNVYQMFLFLSNFSYISLFVYVCIIPYLQALIRVEHFIATTILSIWRAEKTSEFAMASYLKPKLIGVSAWWLIFLVNLTHWSQLQDKQLATPLRDCLNHIISASVPESWWAEPVQKVQLLPACLHSTDKYTYPVPAIAAFLHLITTIRLPS